jgi:hypothetical protein
VGPELTHNPVATDPSSLKATLDDPPAPMRFVKRLHLSDHEIRSISGFLDSNLRPKRTGLRRP